MKTLLSTAALAALLVSGAALADGSGMNGQRMKGQHMSSPHADMQTEMQARMHDDDERHPGTRHDEEDAGKGKHERHSAPGSDHSGRGHNDDDDDDHGPRHMNKMSQDRS